MYDYEPYRKLLEERGIKQQELINSGIINRQNASKLKNNQSITIDTLDKICTKLNCDFSDIVRHIKMQTLLTNKIDDKLKDIDEKINADKNNEE